MNGKLEMFPTSVTSGADGSVVDAAVLRCCGQDNFKVFQLDGQDHPHLQCAKCETSYCPSGMCARVDGMVTVRRAQR